MDHAAPGWGPVINRQAATEAPLFLFAYLLRNAQNSSWGRSRQPRERGRGRRVGAALRNVAVLPGVARVCSMGEVHGAASGGLDHSVCVAPDKSHPARSPRLLSQCGGAVKEPTLGAAVSAELLGRSSPLRARPYQERTQ